MVILSDYSPQLLAAEDVSGAEEGDAGKSQVLVQHEHAYRDEVGVTQVVDEAADVAVVPGVDTVHLPVLHRKHMRTCDKQILTSCFMPYLMVEH